jgi:7,8-dihydropterin-6-yl-methyl-4-(beta-D-ribofuranosyl)aminobenzene 5'-phosphate synthase
MKIGILTDNRTTRRGFLAEHGLSLLIEHEGTTILLDSGQTDVFVRNASAMGLSLADVDAVVLSHGHYDHVGGLPNFPNVGKIIPVHVHEDALRPKQTLNPDQQTRRDIGFPWDPATLDPGIFRWVKETASREILPGIHLLSNIQYVYPFEHHPVGFFVDTEAGNAPDLMRDEQVLVIETPRGLAVFLGCSHPGVINCVTAVQHAFPGQHIALLMGGMHLRSVGLRRVSETIRRFQDMEIDLVAPMHCTGIAAICATKRRMTDHCAVLCAGDILDFPT